jgi:Putative prokaryotic signal transducing protein
VSTAHDEGAHEPARNVPPASGRTVDAGEMPVAYEARNEFEAQCIRSVLEDAGIRSLTLPHGQAIFGFPMRAGASGVPVRVLPDDLSRAKQVIAEARWVGRSVDWDEVDVGEMPPEVARMLARAKADAWIRRALLAVAWVALAVVVLSIAVGLIRSMTAR